MIFVLGIVVGVVVAVVAIWLSIVTTKTYH